MCSAEGFCWGGWWRHHNPRMTPRIKRTPITVALPTFTAVGQSHSSICSLPRISYSPCHQSHVMLCVSAEGGTILTAPPALEQGMVLPSQNPASQSFSFSLRWTLSTFSIEIKLILSELQSTAEGCVGPGQSIFICQARKVNKRNQDLYAGWGGAAVSLGGNRVSLLEMWPPRYVQEWHLR